MSTRTYTSRRANILRSLDEKLKDIDGSGAFLSDLQNNVHPRLKFWDEVVEFPAIHLNAGAETRQYQAGGYKDRFLSVTVRCYVQDEEDSEMQTMLLTQQKALQGQFQVEMARYTEPGGTPRGE